MSWKAAQLAIVVVAVVSTGAFTQAPSYSGDAQAWSWSWEKIQSVTGAVRAGKDLTPKTWPNNARVAVGLSFELDNETASLTDNRTSPSELSQGEYGSRAATKRILTLLEKYQIKATFFVPAVTAKLYPDDVKEIVAKGHEVALHGWIHENNSLLSEDIERQLMKRSTDTLTQIAGVKPVGIRTPSWDFSPATLKIIREFDLLYDSSLMADDRPYEVLLGGQRTGIVELPIEWISDDTPYYGMSRTATLRPQIGMDDVVDVWSKEFDGAYQEGTLFIVTMHPHISGHRARIVAMEKLIQHMKMRQGVWFARHDEIARVARLQM
jgi:peptidoglycan-N-acetylglucosamine deacetylase